MDTNTFRRALGRFVTGVTVVTTRDAEGRPIGLTANSFNSVSLDPPLVLWSLARRSANMAAFEAASHFAVNILAEDQTALSERFARPSDDRFAGLDWTEGLGGAPVLAGCAATFECRTESRHEGGDHVIFLGRVERFDHAERVPLAFHGGRYATTAHYGMPDETEPFADDYLLYLLARASSLASAEFHAELADRGIPVPTWRILATLSGTSGRTVGALASRALMKQPTVTKILDRLEEEGLVTRRQAPGDRRSVLVEITAAGEDVVTYLIGRARVHEKDILSSHTPAETLILKRVLQQLIRRLSADRAGPATPESDG